MGAAGLIAGAGGLVGGFAYGRNLIADDAGDRDKPGVSIGALSTFVVSEMGLMYAGHAAKSATVRDAANGAGLGLVVGGAIGMFAGVATDALDLFQEPRRVAQLPR